MAPRTVKWPTYLPTDPPPPPLCFQPCCRNSPDLTIAATFALPFASMLAILPLPGHRSVAFPSLQPLTICPSPLPRCSHQRCRNSPDFTIAAANPATYLV